GGVIENNITTAPAVPLSQVERLLQNEYAYYGGGGVSLFGYKNAANNYPCVFTMNGGEIRNNTAINPSVGEGAYGGGVLIREFAQFIMPSGSTGVIKNNVSEWKGGGVALLTGTNTTNPPLDKKNFFMQSADAKLEGNTAALYGGAIYATMTPALTYTPTTANTSLSTVTVTSRPAAVAGQVTYSAGQFKNNSVTGVGAVGHNVFVLINAMSGYPSGVAGLVNNPISVPIDNPVPGNTIDQTFQKFAGDAANLDLQ
ncbi:MAG: hypothetical protein LBG72_05215, partial [Spirochaetaceae bacterium]|nr:hypothetical protein [Spirochaetaceae bacterium]